jgi:GYF domain 2
MQEYYIRKEGDEDSRGPFTLEQLASLVEAGQIDRQTFYYDSVAEKWVEVQSSPELVATLFPTKRKLSVRTKEIGASINTKPGEDEKPITVEGMLAAAEGHTAETRGKRNRSGERARAAQWGMRSLGLMSLTSAAALLVNNMDKVETMQLFALITTPAIVFGAVDLFIAVLLFLEVTGVYSFVRLRAAVGLGFFTVYLGVLPDQTNALGALALGSAAAFALTMTTNLWAVIAGAALGLAGMGGFAYFLLN